jgi:hypothetical protein
MIRAYSGVYSEEAGSFDYYYYYYSSDGVKKFLQLCIQESDIPEGNDYTEVINYLHRLFYSVKGTLKVFDYMKEYLGIPFVGDIVYTVNEIRFEISEITTLDMSIYIKYMKEFLSRLLYYNDLKSSIDVMNLIISGSISNSLATGMLGYKQYKPEIIE